MLSHPATPAPPLTATPPLMRTPGATGTPVVTSVFARKQSFKTTAQTPRRPVSTATMLGPQTKTQPSSQKPREGRQPLPVQLTLARGLLPDTPTHRADGSGELAPSRREESCELAVFASSFSWWVFKKPQVCYRAVTCFFHFRDAPRSTVRMYGAALFFKLPH